MAKRVIGSCTIATSFLRKCCRSIEIKTDNQVGSIKYTYILELDDNRATDSFNGSCIAHGLQIGNYK